MRILHRNGIPFFQHLAVSWSLPFATIFFFTVNKKVFCIKSRFRRRVSPYTPVALRTCYIKVSWGIFFEIIKSALQRKGIAYLVGNKNDRFSYQSSNKITVPSVSLATRSLEWFVALFEMFSRTCDVRHVGILFSFHNSARFRNR